MLYLLKEMWSLSPGEYVSLPTYSKRTGWHNGPLVRKDSVEGFADAEKFDLYFSPLTYIDQAGGRKRTNIEYAGVLYADMDEAPVNIPKEIPFPNLIVASGTDGHEHWYWYLEEPAPVSEWELYARGTSEFLGADPGGWDVTQVLRVPDSLNHKHTPPKRVQQVMDIVGQRYKLTDFPKTEAKIVTVDDTDLPPLPDMSREASQSALLWAWDEHLSIEDKLLLTGLDTARDRSKVIWGQIQRWRSQGMGEATIFQILVAAPYNKYTPERLWAQIHK